ncbi:MAG: cellulose synthase complex periplasmic endoglucanase BcsZ [Steroidobacteraceae bacterium]
MPGTRARASGLSAPRGALLALALLACTAGVRAAGTACGPWPEWRDFRAQFVSADGRVVEHASERRQTVSEAQAYALLFAVVADDRAGFGKLLEWTQNNLAAGDLARHLPGWQWGARDDGSYGPLDANSATDADLWIAYALAQAGRAWQEPRYTALSHDVGAQVLRRSTVDVPGFGLALLPAPQGFGDADQGWRMNPSYVPLQVLRGLAAAHPDQRGVWRELADNAPRLLRAAAPRGIAPDWVRLDARGQVDFDPSGTAIGGYDAIRVYLWLGLLDRADPQRATLLQLFEPMARTIERNGRPPERIDARSGRVLAAESPGAFSAAVAPWLEQAAPRAAERQWRRAVRLAPLDDEYYGRALQLFAQGWRSGRLRFDADGGLLRQPVDCPGDAP